MLAQAAKAAGFKPLVIDLFADLDTQACAIEVFKVASLAEFHLSAVVNYFVERYLVSHAIYGSGFEYFPESLKLLSCRLDVYGNDFDTFTRLQDKCSFFSALTNLHILYPEISFECPKHVDGWLLKPLSGQGGLGIKHYRLGDNVTGVYWQKYQTGTQHSVLFLANGIHAQALGFNTQWDVGRHQDDEFMFAGIVNSCSLPNNIKIRVLDWLDKLTNWFNLKGLHSLDFIQADDCTYVLEINARPPASMQLYDGDLISAHIAASQGLLVKDITEQNGYKGYQIVYAEKETIIPNPFAWPTWCQDLPKCGAFIHTGQPICSIIAHEIEPEQVRLQLMFRQQELIKQLERF